MIIAVDFDGTIVEHRYPEIGNAKPLAFDVLKELQKQGHQLILWTYRDGAELDEAVEFCRKRGLEFYAINHSRPNEDFDQLVSRKIYADVYIDDRNIGGFIGWEKIRELLLDKSSIGYRAPRQEEKLKHSPKNKPGFNFKSFFNILLAW
ncbi:hydrolase [Rapidithrix thailandica]|uniref:Hydrolase n=1 Tax=Rapidithrix thailandica TaxID=413964 RepID=A0AAW9S049_9BACT